MNTMTIYPTTFKPAMLKKGWPARDRFLSSDYLYALWLLSNIEANMELSESADEIAGCFSGMFPDVAVSKERTGLFSFMSPEGRIVRISENAAGEIRLNLGRVRKEDEPSLDITELGPKTASEYIMSVLCHGNQKQS